MVFKTLKICPLYTLIIINALILILIITNIKVVNVVKIAELFPFSEFFSKAPQPLFKGRTFEEDFEIAEGCFRHIRNIFTQLEVNTYWPLELKWCASDATDHYCCFFCAMHNNLIFEAILDHHIYSKIIYLFCYIIFILSNWVWTFTLITEQTFKTLFV